MLFTRTLTALAFSLITTMLVTQCLLADEPASDSASGAASDSGETSPAVQRKPEAQNALVPNATAVIASDLGERAANPAPLKEGSDSEVIAALQAGPRALSLAFRMAAKRATPSVVVLYAYGQNGDEPDDSPAEAAEDELPLLERAEIPAPPPTEDKLTGIGSGVIVSEDGLIITNNHVITGAKRVVVQLPDETRVDADVVRGDPDSDVAIVRVKFPEKLQAVTIGNSDQLEIGDWVLAIGSPFRLEATVSAGIISGKDRRMDRIKRSSMLQTDAAINPGNSGGALIDLDGKAIGISTAIATRSGFYQGVGFAIPINQARWIADELDRHGKVRRAAIGTTLVDLKPRIAKKFNLPAYSGILVYQIIKGSVAEKAGIQRYDVITEFAGQRVRDSTALQEAIERQPIGSRQPIAVTRDGKRVELAVELATADNPTGESPAEPPARE
jgi:serine protease Do